MRSASSTSRPPSSRFPAAVRHAARAAPARPGRWRPRPLYAETLAPRLDFGWSELRVDGATGATSYIRAPRPELYDVEADPGEMRNIAAERAGGRGPAVCARSTRALAAAGERRAAAGGRPGDGGAPARARLRAGDGRRPGSGADPKDKVEVARRIARAAGPFRDHAAAAAAYRAIAALDPDESARELPPGRRAAARRARARGSRPVLPAR